MAPHYPQRPYSNPKTYYSSQARRMDKAARCLQTSARRALYLYYPQSPYSNPKTYYSTRRRKGAGKLAEYPVAGLNRLLLPAMSLLEPKEPTPPGAALCGFPLLDLAEN